MKLDCCGSFFLYLSADGVVKALVLMTLFDALFAKGFVEERIGV